MEAELGFLGAAVVGPALAVGARRWSAGQGLAAPAGVAVCAATGLVFALAGWRIGWSWRLGPVLVGAAGLVALAAIDAARHRIPTPFARCALAATFGAAGAASAWSGRWDALAAAALAAAVYRGGLTTVHLLAPAGLGGGDARLAGLAGALLGWASAAGSRPAPGVAGPALTAVWAALVLAIGIGLLTHLVTSRRSLPFGPALGAGALVVLLAQPT